MPAVLIREPGAELTVSSQGASFGPTLGELAQAMH